MISRVRSPRRPSAAAAGTFVLLAALATLALWLLRLHGGWPAWGRPQGSRVFAAAFVAVAYVGFCAFVSHLHRRRTRADAGECADDAEAEVLVVYASQTGFAEQLARRTAGSLRGSGVAVRLATLGELDTSALAQASRVLFLVSTTGEGDAPDGAARFVRDALDARSDLSGLRYGLLALGDREYANFCAFGHRLDTWLRHGGAQPLFDLVEVDNGDEGALRHWQHHLRVLSGSTDLPDWRAPDYSRWRLVERRRLNPGSAGSPCFHVVLEALAAPATWEAGDIAEVGVRNAPDAVARFLAETGLDGDAVIVSGVGRERLSGALARSRLPQAAAVTGRSSPSLGAELQELPHREYSIASIPADGAIHLLIRQWRHGDGSLGIGAGWLTEHAPIGEEIALRVRRNTNFHAPSDARPLILIGNGTGMAGLRALLKARVAGGHRRNWLLFGERNAAFDYLYRGDIEGWRALGFIERLDLAFSRDQAERIYVQRLLREAAEPLRRWVADGAAIYVCGSLEGMAPGIDAALIEVLGDNVVQQLIEKGNYRRDVY